MQGEPGITSTGIGLHLYLRCTGIGISSASWRHCKATGFLLYVGFGPLCYKLAML